MYDRIRSNPQRTEEVEEESDGAGDLLGTTPQVINNKIRLERWSAEELAQVAAFTGGQLAVNYPDGEQILIDPSEKRQEE